MKIFGDTHTHTLMSGHAHSTIIENITEAKKKGHKFIALTDHTSAMPGSPHDSYFSCLWSALPDSYDGVNILRGCEANILDENGTLDISDSILESLEWVIASIHSYITKPMGFLNHTKLWTRIAENENVDVIGHCGEEQFKFDYEKVIPLFAKYKKIVEINNASFRTRPTSIKNCINIASLCVKHGVPLVVSSDAHFAADVGNVELALKYLKEGGIASENILNTDPKRFAKFIELRLNRKFI